VTPLARIEEGQQEPVALARVIGEVDASNVAWVGQRLRAMLVNRSEGLALDLTATTYLDSAGIALVFELAGELEAHRQTLRLVVEPDSPVARMATLSGLDRAVATHATVEAALVPAGG
jgi:anti-anti-sigma factor